MLALSALIYLPVRVIAGLSLVVIAAHIGVHVVGRARWPAVPAPFDEPPPVHDGQKRQLGAERLGHVQRIVDRIPCKSIGKFDGSQDPAHGIHQ
jgi:hypothetical protein